MTFLQTHYPYKILLAALLLITGLSAQAVVPQLAEGTFHSIALKSDGTVWAWGNDAWGELGSDAIPTISLVTSSPSPVQVTGLGVATSIAASAGYSLALKGDG